MDIIKIYYDNMDSIIPKKWKYLVKAFLRVLFFQH